jgi:hypothetical protein
MDLHYVRRGAETLEFVPEPQHYVSVAKRVTKHDAPGLRLIFVVGPATWARLGALGLYLERGGFGEAYRCNSTRAQCAIVPEEGFPEGWMEVLRERIGG